MNAIRPTKEQLLEALRVRRKWLPIICVGLLYLALYLTTTHVEPQGSGGLSGPVEVRVFQSEPLLVAFYPLYLAERWVRNGSLVSASYRFNCDFADRLYVHSWLYGDGKYSWVWYDHWLFALTFLSVVGLFVLWSWKRRSGSLVVAAIAGSLCGFAGIAAWLSPLMFKGEIENGMTAKQRHGGGPVLALRISEPGGGTSYGNRSATHLGGGGSTSGTGAGDFSFEDQVVAIRTNSFLMMFRLKRPVKPDEKVLIVFPFDRVTETNWNGWHIHGKFL